MKKRVADYIAEFLIQNGINKVFTVTGGGAMHLNDAFGHFEKIECIYNHHEQACSMAAEGYTRYSGKVAAVCVTSGPGGTNTLTGVMGAWLDSVPMLVISGQMKYKTTIASTEVPLRQLGFQEYNIIDVAKYMTKYVTMVKDSKKILYYLEKSLYIAKSGRPGPVWLDIPLDVQGEKIDEDELIHYKPEEDCQAATMKPISKEQINDVLNCISEAKRPVILAGNGIRIANAVEKFREVIEKLNIPVVTAWNAHDLLEDSHRLYSGRPGTIGTRGGNFVVQNSDLLISFGCRMNIRQISYEWEKFAKGAYKIAIDIDEAELQKPTLDIDYPINGDINDFFEGVLKSDWQSDGQHLEWIKWCKQINDKYPIVLPEYRKRETMVNPYVFMEELSKKLDGDDIVVASNGTACVCGFQTIEMKKGERMFTNAGASSMGYGLPASIGVSVALENEKRVICLEGDGSIQMNLQELQTVVHHGYNIKIFWLNNDGYHSIRQTQALSFEGEKRGYCGVSYDSGISFPSAEKIALAYGLEYAKIDKVCDLSQKLDKVLQGENPCICEICLDSEQYFSPKLSSKVNKDGTISSPGLEDMFPFLPREELRENMLIWKEEK